MISLVGLLDVHQHWETWAAMLSLAAVMGTLVAMFGTVLCWKGQWGVDDGSNSAGASGDLTISCGSDEWARGVTPLGLKV